MSQWEKAADLSLSWLTGYDSVWYIRLSRLMPPLNFLDSASLSTVTTVFPVREINSDKNPKSIATSPIWRMLDSGYVEVWAASMVPGASSTTGGLMRST